MAASLAAFFTTCARSPPPSSPTCFTRRWEASVDLTLNDETSGDHVVLGHQTLVFGILTILIDNTIRYNRRGSVSVRLVMANDGVSVVISDGLVIPRRSTALSGLAMERGPETMGQRSFSRPRLSSTRRLSSPRPREG